MNARTGYFSRYSHNQSPSHTTGATSSATWVGLVAFAMLAILLLGLAVRLPQINKPLWSDEIVSVMQSSTSFSHMLTLLSSDVHLPLYDATLIVWTRILGTSIPAYRSLSLLLGLGSILLTFALARELFGSRQLGTSIAVLSALFMAASPAAIYYSLEVRPYSMLTFFSLLSCICLLRVLRSIERRDNKSMEKWAVLYTICSILAFYTHLLFLVLFVLQFFVTALWLSRRRKNIFHFGILAMIDLCFFILALPGLRFAILQQEHNRATLAWILSPGLYWIDQGIQLLFGSWSVFVFVMASGCVIGSYVGFRAYRVSWMKRLRRAAWEQLALINAGVFAAAVVPSAILIAGSFLYIPMYVPRYVVYCVPFSCIAIAACIVLLQKIHLKVIVSVLLALCVLASFGWSVAHPAPQFVRDDWRSVAAYISSQKEPADWIIVYPAYAQNSLAFYLNQQCLNDSRYTVQSVVGVDAVTCDVAAHIITPDVASGAACCNESTGIVSSRISLTDTIASARRVFVVNQIIDDDAAHAQSGLQQFLSLYLQRINATTFTKGILVTEFGHNATTTGTIVADDINTT